MGLSTETCRSCGIRQWPCDCQVAALRRRTDYPGDMLAAERAENAALRAENAALRAELAAALKERDEALARPVGYWTRENANLQADLDELLKLAKAITWHHPWQVRKVTTTSEVVQPSRRTKRRVSK